MNWYLKCFKQYADFSGRARRTEYWMFVLFNFIFAAAASILDYALEVEFLSILYSLAIFIPGLAVSVRRLHDVGKSGGWIFIALIPLVGAIWLLVLSCTDSVPGDNKYGPNPKELQTP